MLRHIEPTARDLLVSSIGALVIRLLGAISGILATYFIVFALGAREAGYYFLAFSIVTVLSAFGRMGLDNTVVRFVGSSSELGDSVYCRALFLAVLLSSFLAILLIFAAEPVARVLFHKPSLEAVMRNMAVGVVGISVLTVSAMALQAIKHVSASVFILSIALNLAIVTAVVLVHVETAASVASLLSVCSVGVAAAGIAMYLALRPRVQSTTVSWRDLFASCLPLWVVVTVTQLTHWSGQFVAGIYVGAEQVSLLAVAQRTAALTSFLLTVVNLIVAPRFAALYSERRLNELNRLAINSVRIVSLAAVPIGLTMLLFAGRLMQLFGGEFNAGADLLRILVLGQFVNIITGPVALLLIMSGYERDVRDVTLISGLLALGLAFALTPNFGVYGSAVSVAIAVAGQNLLAVYFVKKRLGINVLAIWRPQ